MSIVTNGVNFDLIHLERYHGVTPSLLCTVRACLDDKKCKATDQEAIMSAIGCTYQQLLTLQTSVFTKSY